MSPHKSWHYFKVYQVINTYAEEEEMRHKRVMTRAQWKIRVREYQCNIVRPHHEYSTRISTDTSSHASTSFQEMLPSFAAIELEEVVIRLKLKS